MQVDAIVLDGPYAVREEVDGVIGDGEDGKAEVAICGEKLSKALSYVFLEFKVELYAKRPLPAMDPNDVSLDGLALWLVIGA